jgi:hypothetical protein
MKTKTHDQNQINLTTTQSTAQGAKPLCDRILLGLDQHAADVRAVRQLDGAGTQPPQRVYPGADLERIVQKQLAQAHKVFAVYGPGPCGFGLARQLTAWDVICYVIRPMKLDTLGKGVNTDKTNAAELPLSPDGQQAKWCRCGKFYFSVFASRERELRLNFSLQLGGWASG